MSDGVKHLTIPAASPFGYRPSLPLWDPDTLLTTRNFHPQMWEELPYLKATSNQRVEVFHLNFFWCRTGQFHNGRKNTITPALQRSTRRCINLRSISSCTKIGILNYIRFTMYASDPLKVRTWITQGSSYWACKGMMYTWYHHGNSLSFQETDVMEAESHCTNWSEELGCV